jgi:SAM-dependent methyltransferase
MSVPIKDDSIYILNNGSSSESERNRLDVQHEICNDIMRNKLLPPHIQAELLALSSTRAPKVLDVATGSAAWLHAMANILPPNAELVGLDYDPTKFPPPSSLASNITLRAGDMYQPFPGDLVGQFDVVHVRLISFALKAGQGAELVKNLMTLLRPGGWIVWSELSVTLATTEPPSLAWFKIQDVHYRFQRAIGADYDVPVGMVAFIREAGCVDCDDRAYTGSSLLYTGKATDWIERTHQHSAAFVFQMLKGIMGFGAVDGMRTQSDVDALYGEFKADFADRDRKMHYVYVRAWGRKPKEGCGKV